MIDPTYVREDIRANPEWDLAFVLSEILNDNAPIGWSRHISTAKCLLDTFEIKRKGEAAVARDAAPLDVWDEAIRIAKDTEAKFYVSWEAAVANPSKLLELAAAKTVVEALVAAHDAEKANK